MPERKSYWVERRGADGVWRQIVGSHGLKSYALGWFHAVTSFAPRQAHRLMADGKVIEERGAEGAPQGKKRKKPMKRFEFSGHLFVIDAIRDEPPESQRCLLCDCSYASAEMLHPCEEQR